MIKTTFLYIKIGLLLTCCITLVAQAMQQAGAAAPARASVNEASYSNHHSIEGYAQQPRVWELFASVELGQAQSVRSLLGLYTYEQYACNYALSLAAYYGHVEVARILVRAGADVNARGGVALWQACDRGHYDVAALLRQYGATVTENFARRRQSSR